MWRREALIIGVLTVLFGLPLALLAQRPQSLEPWPGPAGTRWAGTELRRVNLTSGREGMVSRQYLELRCRRLPLLRVRTGDFWPGPDWAGWAEWRADRVVYQPGYEGARPQPKAAVLLAPRWLGFCPI